LIASNLFVRCKLLAMRYMIAAYHFWGEISGLLMLLKLMAAKTVPSACNLLAVCTSRLDFPMSGELNT